MGRPPHPLDSLAIGDSLLHLLVSSAGSGSGRRVEEAEPPAPPRSSVRFNHQVRVVLVPSRTELKNFKADMWWGEEDYFEFRCEVDTSLMLPGLGSSIVVVVSEVILTARAIEL